jgi:hypothetical protein
VEEEEEVVVVVVVAEARAAAGGEMLVWWFADVAIPRRFCQPSAAAMVVCQARVLVC